MAPRPCGGDRQRRGVLCENSAEVTTEAGEPYGRARDVHPTMGSPSPVLGRLEVSALPVETGCLVNALPPPVAFVLLLVSGWVNRQQQHAVIDYLLEENRVLRRNAPAGPATDTCGVAASRHRAQPSREVTHSGTSDVVPSGRTHRNARAPFGSGWWPLHLSALLRARRNRW